MKRWSGGAGVLFVVIFVLGIGLIGWFIQHRTKGLKAADIRAMSVSQQTNYFKKMSQNNPAEAWHELKSAFIQNGEVVNNVHSLAHLVGNSAYSKMGVDGVRICDSAFGYGCYHGVTEEAVMKLGQKAVGSITQACKQVIRKDLTENYNACIHGMGHGLLSENEYAVAPSLKACEAVADSSVSDCYDGVFMEFSTNAPLKMVSTGDPWTLCTNLDQKYYETCGKYLPILASSKFHYSQAQTIAACGNVGIEMLKNKCFSTIGFMAADQFRSDTGKIAEVCNVSTNRANADTCIKGAADELRFQRYTGSADAATQLCMMTHDAPSCENQAAITAKRFRVE